MRTYTERYHAARRAGAKPVFILFLGTDRALRCFGKQTPLPAWVGTEKDVLEWSARVLSFGDLRQSLSQNSENAFQNLFETEIADYTCTLDNIGLYFSQIAGREQFLNGECSLFQGFDYPDFEFDDFQPLFTGNISKFVLSNTQIVVTAKRTLTPATPADPSVDTSSIYTLSSPGSTPAASTTATFAEIDPVFFEESWTYTEEFIRDATARLDILFSIVNAEYDTSRLEIGIDANDKAYVKYCEDVSAATPSYTTLTSDIVVGTGRHKMSVDWDHDSGQVTINVDGTSQVIDLTPVGAGFVLDTSWSASEIYLAVAPNGNIYASDSVNKRINVYNADGTFQTSFGSAGTGDGEFSLPNALAIDGFGNIYVIDSSGPVKRVQKFNSSHTFVTKWGSIGTGDGQFDGMGGICVSPDDSLIYVSDNAADRIQAFSPTGTFSGKGGTTGSGDGNLDTPTGISCDSLGNVWICDYLNDRVVKFNSSLAWVSNVISISRPNDIVINSNDVYLATQSNSVRKYNTAGTLQYTYASGNNVYSIDYNPTTAKTFYAWAATNIVRLSETSGFPTFDLSDNGFDDDILVGEDFQGDTTTCSFNDDFRLVNSSGTGDFIDVVGSLDLTVDVSASWVIDLTLETITTEITEITQAPADDDIILPDTSRYSDPGENQQNVILPLPYGNCRENSDGGVWICPLINEDEHVYCVAGWPIQSVTNGNTVDVYVDGVLQSSGYTFDESNDYESQGEIAILTFSSDPGGAVSVKCNGKWVDGKLLTNPVDILEDFVNYAASLTNNSPWTFDSTSFAQARAFADRVDYRAAGIIQSNNTLGYWFQVILKSFLGSFQFNNSGEIELKFTELENLENIQEDLLEYEAITLRASQILDNICGRILVNYAVSYSQVDRRFKNNATTSYFRTSDASQTALNPQTWELDFDWCRNTDNIELVQEILLALYADPEYILDYQGQDFKFVPLSLGDQVTATVGFLLDSDGSAVENAVYSLEQKTINLDTFTTTLSARSVNFISVSNPVKLVKYNGNYITYNGDYVRYN